MREWFTAAEILDLGANALPASEKGLSLVIEREGWRDDPARARARNERGGGFEYHVSLLPAEVQARIAARDLAADTPAQSAAQARSNALWSRFERLSNAQKDEARRRLAAVERVELLARALPRGAAVTLVAKEAAVAASTLWTWLRQAGEVPDPDRLAALAPRHVGRTATTECDPRAWSFLTSDYLRPSAPAFDACYRRLQEAAGANGWGSIPSEKTLRRRLEREVPRAVRILRRNGADAAARTYPHQRRDRSVFRAMEAVNADGHKLDVFVRWEDGAIGRPVLVAVQDLFSSLILGHRLDRSEHWGAVRLAFRDAIESYGIPEQCWLDNGRAFASKWVTGRMKNRFRFKVRPEEPEGFLTAFGVQVHWATPYHGQAKPIERAFRDLAEEVAKHPRCAGAYTGNRPDAKPEDYGRKAVPIDEFRLFVAEQITRHNTRTGRSGANAAGRSFAETFRASYEHPQTIVKKAAPAQLRELLLASDLITCRKPDGSLYLGEGNRYWHERLTQRIGRKVIARFDPDDLFSAVAVYDPDGRFLCEADCIDRVGFQDIDAAREHARRRAEYLRAQREWVRVNGVMPADDIAKLIPQSEPLRLPAEPKVVRLVANGRARPVDEGEVWDGGKGFGAAMRRLDAGAVLSFRNEAGGED